MIDPTGSTFNAGIAVPYDDVSALTDNVSFEQIEIDAGTLSSGTVDLNSIGTDTINLSYSFPGGFIVGTDGTLAVGKGVMVTIPAGETLNDEGMLTFASGDIVSYPGDGFGGGQGQIVVTGVLDTTGTTFNSGGLGIAVDPGGVIDPTGSTFNTAIEVPYSNVPTLADNVSFEQIQIEAATLSSGTLSLNAIGITTTNLSYAFPGGFTVQSDGTLAVGKGVAVTIPAGETLADDGTFTFASGDIVSYPGDGFGGGQGQIVVEGVLDAAGTTFNSGNVGITVNSGGLIDPTGSTFNLGIAVPYSDVPALTDNVSFEQIEIGQGTLSGGTLALNAIGTITTNLSYALEPGFAVGSDATLAVGPGVSVTILSGETLADNGILTFASGDIVSFSGNGFGGGFGQIVVAGIMNVTGTTFNGGGSITVSSGGVMNPTGSTFNLQIAVPYSNVPALTDNVSFDLIVIEAGTLSGEALALNAIGTNTTNLGYALAPGFAVGSGGTLAVGPGVRVAIESGETLTVGGTLSFASGDSVVYYGNGFGGGYGQIVVVGALDADGTTFNGPGSITVSSGGSMSSIGGTFTGELVLNAGSNDTLHFNTFSSQLAINSGATINIVGNNLSGVGTQGIIATGPSTADIPLGENYWATTDQTAIEALILDHREDPTTRPLVVFEPVWINSSGTIASPLTAIYSSNNQILTLTAAVSTTGGVPISGGTETFTILDSNNNPIGQTTSPPANVSGGSVSANYTLPGTTAVGRYTIEAEYYAPGTTSPTDTDTSQLLTVTPAASQVAITSAALNQVAGTLGPVTLSLEDSNGDPGASSATDQTISLATTSADGTFYASSVGGAPLTSVVIPIGQSSVTVYYEDTLAGKPTLSASDSALTSVSSTQQATISPAAVAYFTVTTSFASPDPAGTAGTVTVTAYDTYGNRDGSGPDQYEGLTILSSTDLRLSGLPSVYTFTAADAGSHTFTNVIL